MDNKCEQNLNNASKWARFKAKMALFLLPDECNDYTPNAIDSKHLFWYGVGLILFKIAVISFVLYAPNTRIFSDINSQEIVSLINLARQERNLPPVSVNSELNVVADYRASDMIANNYFEHISPSGLNPWYWFKKAGYNFNYAGENLAMDFNESRAVFNAWMQSPTHRDNILDPDFKEVGLAVKTGQINDHRATIAVLEFGSPASTASKSTKTETPAGEPTVTKASPPAPSAPAPAATPTKTIPALTGTPKPPAAPTLTTSPAPISPSPDVAGLSVQPETSASPAPAVEQTTILQPQPLSTLAKLALRAPQAAKSLYLYFTLFLIAALGVNIFVKIRIQRVPTIIATTFMICLSAALTII